MDTPLDAEPDDVGEFDDDLDPLAELVALRLAAGQSHAEAASAIGRGPKWVQRKMANDTAFRRRVTALRSARVDQAAAGLGNLLERAVAAVGNALDSERPADQLHAARLVFDRSRLFRSDAELVAELDELRYQIADLQRLLDERGGTGS